jgi:hypothetical protein
VGGRGVDRLEGEALRLVQRAAGIQPVAGEEIFVGLFDPFIEAVIDRIDEQAHESGAHAAEVGDVPERFEAEGVADARQIERVLEQPAQ